MPDIAWGDAAEEKMRSYGERNRSAIAFGNSDPGLFRKVAGIALGQEIDLDSHSDEILPRDVLWLV